MAVPSCAAMDTAIKDVTLRRKEYLLPNVKFNNVGSSKENSISSIIGVTLP